LIRTLIDLGVQVPADVSVIGFDNIFAAELVTPPLTTVAAPLRRWASPPSKTSWRSSGAPIRARRNR
jgi:Periplasmic binding protein-like domain